jgi:hypothetical protein
MPPGSLWSTNIIQQITFVDTAYYCHGTFFQICGGRYVLGSSDLVMPRTYKRTSTRGAYGEDALKSALLCISSGESLIGVAKRFGIPAKTLGRHRDGKVRSPGKVNLGNFRPKFDEAHEEMLVQQIQMMEKSFFGLTTTLLKS